MKNSGPNTPILLARLASAMRRRPDAKRLLLAELKGGDPAFLELVAAGGAVRRPALGAGE